MLGKKGFILIESILLLEVTTMIVLLLSNCVFTYYTYQSKENKQVNNEEEVNEIKKIYE